MKPGVSAATTGVLPRRRATATVASTTDRAVRGAGDHLDQGHQRHRVEEVHPHHPLGWAAAEAMRATDRLLVLVARIVSGAAAASSRRKASRLSSRSSGIASTTRSTAASSSSEPASADAARAPLGLGRGELALLDLARQEAGDPLVRPLVRPGDRVVQQRLDPRLGRDLGDAGAHRPGAQDPMRSSGSASRRRQRQGSAAPASRRRRRPPRRGPRCGRPAPAARPPGPGSRPASASSAWLMAAWQSRSRAVGAAARRAAAACAGVGQLGRPAPRR